MTCSTHSKGTIFEIYTSHGQSRLSYHTLVLTLLSLLIILSSCSKENVTSTRQFFSPDTATLEFYKGQSVITNPNKYGYLYDTLPETIPELCQVVQGLLWHEFLPFLYGVKLTDQRRNEAGLREVERILQRAMELSDQPLIQPRNPTNRVTSVCRDYAVLLCSFLRHKGIPARMRVGYANYLHPEKYLKHYLCEYWCHKRMRWIQVDAQLDDIQKKYYKIDFDPLDVPAKRFLYAGEYVGLFDEKYNWIYRLEESLIQDLAALNKVEIELSDTTQYMRAPEHQINRPKKLSNPEFALFQQIADLTTSPRDCLPELQAIYKNHSELQFLINQDKPR